MKKVLFGFTLLTALVFITATPAHAFGSSASTSGTLGITPGYTVVTGSIRKADNSPVPGANVSIKCNSVQVNTTSAADGYYYTVIEDPDCVVGDPVVVTATKDGNAGANGQIVSPTGNAFVNIAIVEVKFAVPEFGMLPGALAMATSVGSLFLMRRRMQTVTSDQ